LPGRRKLAEPVGELRVRDDIDVVEPFDLGQLPEQPLEDRASPDLEQRLGLVQRQRIEPRGVPGC
jgi:hypothetical protein